MNKKQKIQEIRPNKTQPDLVRFGYWTISMFLFIGFLSCSQYKHIYPHKGPNRNHVFKCESDADLTITFESGFKNDTILVKSNEKIVFNESIDNKNGTKYYYHPIDLFLESFPDTVFMSINKKNFIIHVQKGYCYIYLYKKRCGVRFVMYPGLMSVYDN